MDGKGDGKVVSFPGADEYGEEAREARVRALKKRVASGEYRLDAGAAAEAMVAEGVFETNARPAAIEDSEEMRRAMGRFVVQPAPEPTASDGGARAASGS
jgi:hypothetical protein